MTKLFITFFVAISVTPSAWSVENKNSQIRMHGESAKHARQRISKLLTHEPGSAVALEIPFDSLDFSQVPQWSVEAPMDYIFEAVRDARFIQTLAMPYFLRRISWLYPDDGCYARAAVTNQKLEEWGIPRLKKLFVFGDLNVKTKNAIDGIVEWWYHNVPVIQKDGVVYIFDAAVEPSRALPIDDWIRLMGQGTKTITAAICDPFAYGPWDRCIKPSQDVEEDAWADQISYLQDEWFQLKVLGRNPERELGDHPPWKKD